MWLPLLRPKLVFTAVIFLTVFLLFFWNTVPRVTTDAFRALHLLPEKEHFSELYFEEPANLPAVVAPDGRVTFSFTVRNHEGVRASYSYRVSFQNENASEVVWVKKTMTLESESSATIVVDRLLPTSTRSGLVTVSLVDRNQKLFFHLHRT